MIAAFLRLRARLAYASRHIVRTRLRAELLPTDFEIFDEALQERNEVFGLANIPRNGFFQQIVW